MRSPFTWSGIKAIHASATLCIAAIMWVALSRVRLPTCNASADVGQYTHAERKWAKEYLGRLRFALAIPLCLDACSALVVGASFHCSAPWLFKFSFLIEGLQRLLSLIVEVTSMLLLVGIFQLQKPEIQLQVPSMQRGVSPEQRSRRWRKVVSKLAKRGMNVAGWWFQIFLNFSQPLGMMFPSDEVMFFRWGQPPTRWECYSIFMSNWDGQRAACQCITPKFPPRMMLFVMPSFQCPAPAHMGEPTQTWVTQQHAKCRQHVW